MGSGIHIQAYETTQQGSSIVEGFEKIFKRIVHQPVNIAMDKGSEFIDRRVQKFLNERDISFDR
jgi:hypothetical protein